MQSVRPEHRQLLSPRAGWMLVVGALVSAQSAAAGEGLILSPSALRRVGEAVVFTGAAAHRPRTEIPSVHAFGDRRFFTDGFGGPLYSRQADGSGLRRYRISELAAAGGWQVVDPERAVPDGLRGLFRSGNELWMGTNALGVLRLDPATSSWTRYDGAEDVVAGLHTGVLFADASYVFAANAYRRERPTMQSELAVYSFESDAWRSIEALPRDAVRSLGHEDSPLASVRVDHRIYADALHVPPVGRKMGRSREGSYLLEREFSNGTRTTLELHPEVLERAFEQRPVVPSTAGPLRCRVIRMSRSIRRGQNPVALLEVIEPEGCAPFEFTFPAHSYTPLELRILEACRASCSPPNASHSYARKAVILRIPPHAFGDLEQWTLEP